MKVFNIIEYYFKMSEYEQIMRIFLLVQCRRRQERHLMGRRQVLQDFFSCNSTKGLPNAESFTTIRGVTLTFQTVQNANTAESFN